MADIFNTNLRYLEDMILDEEKLITYTSLCKELCIHVNESKIILSQALHNLRRKDPNLELNVNYILSGIVNENTAKTVVCTESELEVFKKDFKAIFFQHIYSINKGNSRVDCASLLSTNKFEDLILCQGIIKSNNCEKLTANEIGVLKSKSQDIVSLPVEKVTDNIHKKIKRESTEKPLNESENIIKDINGAESESMKNIQSENISPKKYIKGKVNNVNIRQKGIAGFFNKSNGNCSKKETIIKEVMKTETIFEKSGEIADKCVKVNDVTKFAEKVKVKKDISDKDKRSQTLTKKSLKVDKKRKRVLCLTDSDSDDDINDNEPFVAEENSGLQNESEDEIPPTPSINTVKITSGILNPKKKRKIVNKTYIGDDGYFVTRKEEIYESGSENDEEVRSKENVPTVSKIKAEITPKENKNETKNTKKKVSPPQIGKQSTLMNYFKKK